MPSVCLGCLSVLAVATFIAPHLQLTAANTKFFVRLDHYENYNNQLQVHARCDSGNVCDPLFVIRVSGSWGQSDAASDCISNKMQITFGDKIGTNLTNPLHFVEQPSLHPVLIHVWIKDCYMDRAMDDIGEFHAQIAQLPRPFLFTDRVDFSDSERTKSIELTPSLNTPLSTKLRVTVWRQCEQFYYGQDCSKFCRPLPGLSCHPETGEMLNCRGSVCNTGMAAPATSGPAAAQQTAEPVGVAVQSNVKKQKAQQANLTLIVTLSCLLALTTVAAASILVIVRRCVRPKKRPRCHNQALIPPTHSMAVGLRDAEAGSDPASPLQQDFVNGCYTVQTRPLPAPGGVVTATAVAREAHRPESDVYETPEEPALPPGVAVPPPLPARDNLFGQFQRTPLSRSFSKPNK
ncbi:hypothetical protein BOX15_Mlig032942g1 [Macrostomum lignano]|uniref:DSL domain-containing protein n=1 Tax=Macrostomum lignano TaxID=282301 RepID=A0A267EP95_9PLAT|nr:hypothetical protein BOX15_Mlig032942g1 [Macrostomum lignano]